MMNRFFTLILALVILSATGFALTRGAAKDAQLEVLSTDDARIKARTNGDLQTMSRIYADDYTLVTAEGDLRTKEDQLGELRSGQLRFRPVEILERSVRLYGNTAIVLSRERSTIIRDGQDIGGDFRANRVYITRDGRWQLVLTQATRIARR